MTDLGKSRSGPKESDNRDKSLHGLMVALVMAGVIAGSAILFAYASSDGSVPAAADTTASEAPEPIIIEKPVYIERIKYVNRTVEVEKPVYINRTIEVEKPVYINRTVEVEKEVPVYIEKEVEKPVYIYVDKTEDDSDTSEDKQKDDDLPEEPEQDTISKRVMDLLHRVTDDDDEKEEKDDDGEDEDDDDENKSKGHKHDDDDEEDDD
ncbi:MAG TPA: IMCp domain-containing protein [Nitrososphaera sp.]|nr:IMCp domain-containing protein [Nitrososphaera sp.]